MVHAYIKSCRLMLMYRDEWVSILATSHMIVKYWCDWHVRSTGCLVGHSISSSYPRINLPLSYVSSRWFRRMKNVMFNKQLVHVICCEYYYINFNYGGIRHFMVEFKHIIIDEMLRDQTDSSTSSSRILNDHIWLDSHRMIRHGRTQSYHHQMMLNC